MIYYSVEPTFTGNMPRFRIEWTSWSEVDLVRKMASRVSKPSKLTIREGDVYKKRGFDALLVTEDDLKHLLILYGEYLYAIPAVYAQLLSTIATENRVRDQLGVRWSTEHESHYGHHKRSRLIRLLENGGWHDDDYSLGVQIANSMIRKIDLGRRSDLKLSRHQDPTKYQSEQYRVSGLKRWDNPEAKEEAARIAKRDELRKAARTYLDERKLDQLIADYPQYEMFLYSHMMAEYEIDLFNIDPKIIKN